MSDQSAVLVEGEEEIDEPEGNGKVSVAESSILDLISPAKTKVEPYIKGIIYGQHGVGKTTFCAGAPNPLFIDIERGTDVLANSSQLRDTPVYTASTLSQVMKVLKAAVNKDPALDIYDTYVIDSITFMQKVHLLDLLDRAARADRTKKRDPFSPIQADWNKNTNFIFRLFMEFWSLDKNLILIARVREDKVPGQTELTKIGPAITPALATDLSGLVGFVGYLDARDKGGRTIRSLRLQATPTIDAKNRIGGLPPVIENPTLDMIYQTNLKRVNSE